MAASPCLHFYCMVPEGKGFSFETQALLGQKMEERKGLQETWRQRQLQKGPDGMKATQTEK